MPLSLQPEPSYIKNDCLILKGVLTSKSKSELYGCNHKTYSRMHLECMQQSRKAWMQTWCSNCPTEAVSMLEFLTFMLSSVDKGSFSSRTTVTLTMHWRSNRPVWSSWRSEGALTSHDLNSPFIRPQLWKCLKRKKPPKKTKQTLSRPQDTTWADL